MLWVILNEKFCIQSGALDAGRTVHVCRSYICAEPWSIFAEVPAGPTGDGSVRCQPERSYLPHCLLWKHRTDSNPVRVGQGHLRVCDSNNNNNNIKNNGSNNIGVRGSKTLLHASLQGAATWEFSDMIREPLPIYCESFMKTTVAVFR